MRIAAGITGGLIILIVLWDAFETIILPRRVTRRYRFSRLFYRLTWAPWSIAARHLRPLKRREAVLAFYGPLSVLLLLVIWAIELMFGFALVHWATQTVFNSPNSSDDFRTDLYFSATTFATLGLGDVSPHDWLGRLLADLEAGMGFGFLAVVIGYLPVIYQAFSRREVNITLLDARAGSPSSSVELLRRYARADNLSSIETFLAEWERWAAELMESHLSYPVLAYFRSQHDNQSWLSALTTVLDTCTLVLAGGDGLPTFQAQLTFAMARHAVVDLAQVLNAPPRHPEQDRLTALELKELRRMLAEVGVRLHQGEEADRRIGDLRQMYEPYVQALGERFLFRLPPWIPPAKAVANWQTSAWGRVSASSAEAASMKDDVH